jgi:hypothetical protein
MSAVEKPAGRNIILWAAENIEALVERHGFKSKAAEQFGRYEPHMLLAAPPVHGESPDLQTYLTGLVEGVVRTNLRLAEELFLVDSPQAFAHLQQRFVCEYLTTFQRGIAALMHATNSITEEPAPL